MADYTKKFAELEQKIQELIVSHVELKTENEALKKENKQLTKTMEAEKARVKWFEDGYKELETAEKSKNARNMSQVKKRVKELISEVDKTIALVNEDSK